MYPDGMPRYGREKEVTQRNREMGSQVMSDVGAANNEAEPLHYISDS